MDDPRLGDLIVDSNPDITLIGFASDQGCIDNGGRPGAKEAPHEVFKFLPRVGVLDNREFNINLSNIRLSIKGIVNTHSDLKQMVSEACQDSIPIIVGGSNDQSFPNALGLISKYPNLDVINIDAHLDVRPGKGHSGSPFQQLLNCPQFQGNFYEYATQGSQSSGAHVDFVKSKGGVIIWLNTITSSTFKEIISMGSNPLFVSFDIDSIRSCEAPGVSCPGTMGLTAEEALMICFTSGASKRVVALDISEFNPKIENNITLRLVTQMIYYFILGFRIRQKIN